MGEDGGLNRDRYDRERFVLHYIPGKDAKKGCYDRYDGHTTSHGV
jgi:hypothetical protein